MPLRTLKVSAKGYTLDNQTRIRVQEHCYEGKVHLLLGKEEVAVMATIPYFASVH